MSTTVLEMTVDLTVLHIILLRQHSHESLETETYTSSLGKMKHASMRVINSVQAGEEFQTYSVSLK